MSWTARLLDEPPVSGSIPERHYDNGRGGLPWVWALFVPPSNGESWAGSFRAGDLVPYRAVHVVPTRDDAVVVAGGYAYWLSLSTREVAYGHYFVAYSVEVPHRPLVVAATFTELAVLSPSGAKWCPARVALDGITITEVTSQQVRGEAEGYTGRAPFVMDLDTMELRGGLGQHGSSS